MKVSFYVLTENKAQDFLGFICQLTQTALNKSNQSLLILAEDETLIGELDKALWAQDDTSFIPHQRLLYSNTEGADMDVANTNTDINNQLLAPVLLASYMPTDFKGIVLNTTIRPVNDFINATSNTLPTRILELIKPDTVSTEAGRAKYKHYQQLGYELTHFKV
ncbi:DNA polymerase III subunit chi [Psychrobacter sp. P11F6]|uniref:DNA polymerase III subunit chi n=1 Tax=Psychrobacter sp. P11F6 TaxID=1699621 RepID=UPI0007123852|nr:DNA polymerase III subunit chi [Psychrobacter sp. P11F6]KRG33480.1 DNA polymerase III subunit chi [Psychrobacter sp. P11F6]